MIRRFRFALALAGALAMCPASAAEQPYPLKPVRFMVPFAPGGGSDVVARIIAADLAKFLGQQMIIDNRAGAQGVVGSTIVSQSAPDGYTIMLAHVGTIGMNPWLFKNIYDPVRDFTHITLATSQPTVVVVNPSVPAANLQQLIALAKSKPGAMTYASGSTIGQLSAEYLLLLTGTKMLHVPYKGGSQAILDVVSGRVELVFGSLPASLPMVKAGKVKVLAVAGPKRLSAIPDVPTSKEAGLPEFDVDVWYSIAGPAKMPKPIVTRLNTELRKVLDLPSVKERLIAQGVEAATNTPEQMTAMVAAEHKRWGKVVKAAGLEGAEK